MVTHVQKLADSSKKDVRIMESKRQEQGRRSFARSMELILPHTYLLSTDLTSLSTQPSDGTCLFAQNLGAEEYNTARQRSLNRLVAQGQRQIPGMKC